MRSGKATMLKAKVSEVVMLPILALSKLYFKSLAKQGF
jgi:hypothetical protein